LSLGNGKAFEEGVVVSMADLEEKVEVEDKGAVSIWPYGIA